ncbi:MULTISPECIES: efflux RND transporter periplasmic adaptor subunit [unclassified Azospirillum]|uniref:efflux RND transporter periplasmic adaptor subunit n=1 Tax=unclassified Azospirillum TaxID=2630922 RepID=UPI000B6DE324|nr:MULTISPECIES: efflux RND transporter periplasmic adaptor subunit [unclassified Azospirillum]SNS22056.1 RND family efflux transporter, MFP subunit [Azospirillum sp. RU38E]SNS40031.1 RND family efflux transporter, MFP subunit [Azospirillum sp. RU37A]
MRRGKLLAVAMGMAGALALAGCGKNETGQGTAPAAPQVVVSQPLQKNIREWDEYTGRFTAVEGVEIRARVSGYLTSVNFHDGDLVNKGDLLFIIDPRPYQAALDAAQAAVAQAKSQVTLAERELNRARDLRQTQAVSQSVLDTRSQSLQAAQAGLLAVEAQQRAAALNLEFTQVRAPVTGRVSNHRVSVGNLVSGGSAESTLLTTIVSLDPIYFYFDADQASYLRYQRLNQSGQRQSGRVVQHPVELALPDETGYSHPGKLDFIDNSIDDSTGTIRARAVFDNPDGVLTPGLFGRLRLAGRSEYQGLLVPDSAIGTDQNRRYVMVVGADNKVVMRPVTLGPLIDGLRVVREGLAANERIVTAGLLRVRPGATVAPVEKPLQAAETGAKP